MSRNNISQNKKKNKSADPFLIIPIKLIELVGDYKKAVYLKYPDFSKEIFSRTTLWKYKKSIKNKNKLIVYLKNMSKGKEVIRIYKPLALALRSLPPAIIYAQCLYWAEQYGNPFYHHYAQFFKEFPFISPLTIKRAIWKLEEDGLIKYVDHKGYLKIKETSKCQTKD